MESLSTTLLSICIPTYNRFEDLVKRLEELSPLLTSSVVSDIELCVQDNSDSICSEKNRLICKNYNVSYQKNQHNIGLGGSICQLAIRSKGKYIVFFSDNDIILVNSLLLLIASLNQHLKDCELRMISPSVFILPFLINGNSTYAYDPSTSPPSLNECLVKFPNILPCCLLSTMAIPKNLTFTDDNDYVKNSIFPQSIVLFSLTRNPQLIWHQLPIVIYTLETNPRFKLIDVANSEISLVDTLSVLSPTVSKQSLIRKKKAVVSLLLQLNWFRLGCVSVKFATKNWRLEVLYFVLQHRKLLTIKSLTLLTLLFSPLFLLKLLFKNRMP
jgi:glycosyltransferase involved in cell wall biosynthesis